MQYSRPQAGSVNRAHSGGLHDTLIDARVSHGNGERRHRTRGFRHGGQRPSQGDADRHREEDLPRLRRRELRHHRPVRDPRRQGLRRDRSQRPPQRDHHRRQARAQERARHGRVHDHVPDREADRHVEGVPLHVAGRAQPHRPHHHRRAAAQFRRCRNLRRLAGRRRGPHGPGREQRLCRRARRQECRWLPDHRARDGADHEHERPELVGNVRRHQPDPVQAGRPEHGERQTRHPHGRAHGRYGRRRTRDRVHRLGVREMQRREPVPRHARSDTALPQGRLRSEADVSRRLHREGPAGAGPRLCRLPRRRLVLQEREGGFDRRREPARGPGAVGGHARSVAIGQHDPPVPASGLQRRRAGPQGLRRRLADHRRQAHRSELPVRHARRRLEDLRVVQRGHEHLGEVRGQAARASGRRHPRPLHGDQHLPARVRTFRRGRVLGPEDLAVLCRHVGG